MTCKIVRPVAQYYNINKKLKKKLILHYSIDL